MDAELFGDCILGQESEGRPDRVLSRRLDATFMTIMVVSCALARVLGDLEARAAGLVDQEVLLRPLAGELERELHPELSWAFTQLGFHSVVQNVRRNHGLKRPNPVLERSKTMKLKLLAAAALLTSAFTQVMSNISFGIGYRLHPSFLSLQHVLARQSANGSEVDLQWIG